jgi:hypothetical protein
MTDLDREVRDRLRALSLPPAPDSVHLALDQTVREVTQGRRRDRRRAFVLLGIAAVVATSGFVIASVGGAVIRPAPERTQSAAVADATPAPTPAPSAFPTATLGLHVYSVSELLAARAARRVSGGPIALAGFWSALQLAHSCAPPPKGTGALQLWCSDGEFGITERDEQIMELVHPNTGQVRAAVGPHLTPYLPNAAWVAPLYTEIAPVHGQPYPPVPILVVGHVDDPRAAECRPEARKLCEDRFVVDELVSFDPAAIPTPGITPTPTPFPFDSPPALTLDVATCAAEVGTHDFSFVGWMSAAGLTEQIGSGRSLDPFDSFAVAITKSAVPATTGTQLDEHGKRYRLMGRRVCISRQWDSGAIEFDYVKGSLYRLYTDGRAVPTDSPFG